MLQTTLEYDALEEKNVTRSMTVVGVMGNLALAALKLIAGIFGNSVALISDALHSLSDLFATMIAFFGSALSKKEADVLHPYGHERIESLATLLLGVVLFICALAIGYEGLEKLITQRYLANAAPGLLALFIAIVSIVCKEAMYRYTKIMATRIHSEVFMADAWHHRSDALSSIGAAAGIIACQFGFLWGDALAAIIICLFVLKVALRVLKDAINSLLDTPADEEITTRIIKSMADDEEVQEVTHVRTRKFGSRVYAEAEINIDGSMSAADAHSIAHRAEDTVEKQIPQVKHIEIHLNPV